MLAAHFTHRYDTDPTAFAASWGELVHALGRHVERADKAAGPLWAPAIYRPGATRGNAGVIALTCAVVDLDGDPIGPTLERIAHAGHAYHAYTTHSHRPDNPRWHIVIPLARPVAARDWRDLWHRVHRWLTVGDPTTSDPARVYYMPQHPPNAVPATRTGIGSRLDPETLPATGTAPRLSARLERTFAARHHRAPDVIEHRRAHAPDIPAAARRHLADFRLMRVAGAFD